MQVYEYGKENEKTVLLLHGGGLSSWNYRKEAELLSQQFHVILPVLDGHARSSDDFVSIEENAKRIIAYIDENLNGCVCVLGGLSLGAQTALEMMSLRKDIAQYAMIESAAVIKDPLTNSLVGPTFASSYGLVSKKWFAKMQSDYLKIDPCYFEEYYRDTSLITKENMIAFTKASAMYEIKESLRQSTAKAKIVIGEKEQKRIHKSAQLIHEYLSDSTLEIKKGLVHGQYSLDHADEYVNDLFALMNG